MTQAERLQALKDSRDPMARMAKYLNDRAMAEAIAKMDVTKGEQGEQGERGPKGDKGDSVQGPRGWKGEQGEKGPRGDRGETGAAGKDGKDGKNGRDAIAPAPQTIIDAVLRELAKGNLLEPKHIKGLGDNIKSLQELITFLKAGGFRGGGMSLVSGSNVTIVQNPDGTYTISAAGGSSSNLSTEQVVAVQSGDNATIDLTQLAYTFTSILFTTLEGAVLLPNGNAGIPTPSWSRTGNTITVYNADATGAFLVQYTY